MPDRSAGSTAAGDRDAGDAVTGPRAAVDRKGGLGRTTLVAVILALPVVDIAFIAGDAARARTVLLTLGARNLPEVLIGIVLSSPWFGSALAVGTSRVMFAFFAAHGALARARRGPRALTGTIAVSLVHPIAVGVLATCLYGWPWGVATGLVSAGLRQGVVIEYRTGHRHHHTHEHEHKDEHERRVREREQDQDQERERDHEASASRETPSGGRPRPLPRLRPRLHAAGGRFATVEQWIAGLLVALVLPIAGLAAALDGRAWAPVVDCTLDLPGSSAQRGRLIELSRDATGVVGWDPDAREVLNGVDCTAAPSQTVRPAWWNE